MILLTWYWPMPYTAVRRQNTLSSQNFQNALFLTSHISQSFLSVSKNCCKVLFGGQTLYITDVHAEAYSISLKSRVRLFCLRTAVLIVEISQSDNV